MTKWTAAEKVRAGQRDAVVREYARTERDGKDK